MSGNLGEGESAIQITFHPLQDVLLAQLRGEPAARMTQLAMEYDPQPPFDAGSPGSAGPEAVSLARGFVASVHARTLQIAQAWRERQAVR